MKNLLGEIERRLFGFRSFGRGSVIKPFPRRIAGARYIEIGEDCFFGDGLVLVASDAYMGRTHQPSCVFGNRCVFGSDAVISCTNTIRIGNDVLTSSRVFLGDSYHGYEDITRPVLDQPMAGEAAIVIGDGCFLGIGSVVLPGTVLGKGCYVGANAVVKGTFDDHTVIAGVPGRAVRQYDAQEKAWVKTRREFQHD